jgi:hypothetical protein
MKPRVEVETVSEREHMLKVDGEIIGLSKTQYDALFHKHFLDRKFDEAFKAGRESMKTIETTRVIGNIEAVPD